MRSKIFSLSGTRSPVKRRGSPEPAIDAGVFPSYSGRETGTAMRRSVFGFWRAYRLRPVRDEVEDHVSQLTVDGPRSNRMVLLPYAGGLGYFVVPTAGASLAIDIGEEFRTETLDLVTSLWVRLRLWLLFKRKKYLKFEEFSLFCYGRKPERKRFTTFNQDMFNKGVALDGELMLQHPELLTGWPTITPMRNGVARGASNDIAVVAHVFYEDAWPDVAEALKRVKPPFDLIVTTVPCRRRLITAIHGDFPDADVEVMENRGRDVRPFVALLEQGRLDRYRYVCKVHGKKSIHGGRRAYIGKLWRRRLLFDLLAAPGLVETVIERFERDPKIGMIGPRAFRMPGKLSSEAEAWMDNRPMVLDLAQKMGVPPDRFRLDFFAGTMFWVRPEALAPLRALRLVETFPGEHGLLDGSLEHAIERLLSTAVVEAGYRLEAVDGGETSLPAAQAPRAPQPLGDR